MGQGATLYRTKILDEKQVSLNEVQVKIPILMKIRSNLLLVLGFKELTGETVSIEAVEADQASGASFGSYCDWMID